MSDKPMRQLLPEIAALVDAFRDAGLTDNKTIAQGLSDGRCWFKEGDHYIGLPGAREASEQESAQAIKGQQLVLQRELDAMREISGRGKRARQ